MRADIVAVFGMIALLNIDLSISIPTLAAYVHRLGGSTTLYGVAAGGGWVCAIPALPCFGFLSDRFSHRSVLILALAVMACGGFLYGLANSCSPSAAPYLVVAGRFLIGSGSGCRAACNSYLATYSDPDSRTVNLGIAQVVMKVAVLCGPPLNLLLVSLPEGELLGLRFDSLSWAGYAVTVLAALYIPVVALFLRGHSGSPHQPAPAPAPAAGAAPAGKRADEPWEGRGLLGQVWATGGWLCCQLAFTNAFTMMVFQYFVPLYASGFDQVQLSLFYCAWAAVGAVASAVSAKFSRSCYERSILMFGQLWNVAGMAAMVLFIGRCGESALRGGGESSGSGSEGTAEGVGGMPTWAFALLGCFWQVGTSAQAPGVQGLFPNVVGKHRQGALQSVFLVRPSP